MYIICDKKCIFLITFLELDMALSQACSYGYMPIMHHAHNIAPSLKSVKVFL